MREALRGLTTRGRCFLAAAFASVVASLALGERDLLRVAVLLTALPLLSTWYVGRTRYRLACARSLEPARVPAGTSARVVLRLRNQSRLTTGTLMLEDRLPYALGSRPRLVLERLGAYQSSTVAYTVRADVRGKYPVGPLLVRLTDPFGLCELTRSFPRVDQLTVVPQVTDLPQVRLTGEYTGAGNSTSRSVAVHGEDDAATREYRRGDDLRRVHWRSTARVGELMVRREEQPWESRATVVLDTRASAHRGEGPTSSFEWAVAAVASIAAHLHHNGYRLRMVAGEGIDVETGNGEGTHALLDHLAEVSPRGTTDMVHLVDQVRRQAKGGLVVCVFGTMTAAETELLSGLRAAGNSCVALLLDSTTWLSLDHAQRDAARQAHQLAELSLLRLGWRVVEVSHGSRLAVLWPRTGRDGQGLDMRTGTIGGGTR